MSNLARWLYPILLSGAWGSAWAVVTVWRQGAVPAAFVFTGAAMAGVLLAAPAVMLAARPLVAYFFGSSGRTFVIIWLVVSAMGGPRLALSSEFVTDVVILAIVASAIAGVAAAAAQYALRRQTPDSPNGLEDPQ